MQHIDDVRASRWPTNALMDDAVADLLGDSRRFFFVAKPGQHERPVIDGVRHPAVKPLALMRELVRLVTPPGGVVLDPFAGSGTTLEAATLEGMKAIGVERDEQFMPLIRHRIDRAA